MVDYISRQAAISAICSACGKIDCDKMDKCEKLQLPPANCSEFPNSSDTISRAKAIDALMKRDKELRNINWYDKPYAEGECRGIDEALAIVSNLPSARPEIIRCKDCKHWIPYDWMFSEIWRSRNMVDYPEDEIGCDCCDMSMGANDFCSRAERRTDEYY